MEMKVEENSGETCVPWMVNPTASVEKFERRRRRVDGGACGSLGRVFNVFVTSLPRREAAQGCIRRP